MKTNRREAFQKLVTIGKLNSIKLTYFLETEKDFKLSLCKTQITKSFKYPQGHVKFTSCFPFVREPNRRNRSTSLQSRRNEVNIRLGEVKWRQISKLKYVDDTDMREVVFPYRSIFIGFHQADCYKDRKMAMRSTLRATGMLVIKQTGVYSRTPYQSLVPIS